MLKYIDYLYTIYQKRSFSRAAEDLFISQPSLSNIVKKVEADLGAPIFDRSTNPISLTEAGEYYIRAVEQMMEIEENLREQFSKYKPNAQKQLVIGASSYFCTHLLPDCIMEYEDITPSVHLSAFEANTDDLHHCLKSGIIDVCINVDHMDPALFDCEIWKKEHLILAVPSTFPVNQKLKEYQLSWEQVASQQFLSDSAPAVSLKYFASEPFLFLKKRSDLYERTLKMCHNAGFEPHILLYLDQMLSSYYIAKEGKGICFIRSQMLSSVKRTDQLCFYKVDDPLSLRNIFIYYRKNKLQDSVRDFIDFFKDYTDVQA